MEDKQIRAWRRWQEYILSIGLQSDVFLETFTLSQRNAICIGFCQALRQGELSGQSKGNLAGAIRDSIGYVSQAFKSSMKPDPAADFTGA